MIILNVLIFSYLISTIRADTPSYTPEQCDGFIQLQVDILNYDRYDEYFNEESTMTLAQSGTYQGPDQIEEYVRFADTSSPYINERYNYNMTYDISGFDPIDGVCTFLIYSTNGIRFNDNLTKGGLINRGVIQKLYYSIPQNKVTTIYIYYTEAYLYAFFGLLDTDKNLQYICDILTGPSCADVNELDGNLSTKKCMKKKLESFQCQKVGAYVDSNTRGCRALHAVFAEDNPTHCAHISLAPVEDVNGKIKCQESEGILPSDLFSEDEILSLEQMCLNDKQIGSASCVKISDQLPVCEDDKTFKYKGRSNKKCKNFLREGNVEKKCKKEADTEGNKVYDYCPYTCGIHGKGPCSNLKEDEE